MGTPLISFYICCESPRPDPLLSLASQPLPPPPRSGAEGLGAHLSWGQEPSLPAAAPLISVDLHGAGLVDVPPCQAVIEGRKVSPGLGVERGRVYTHTWASAASPELIWSDVHQAVVGGVEGWGGERAS